MIFSSEVNSFVTILKIKWLFYLQLRSKFMNNNFANIDYKMSFFLLIKIQFPNVIEFVELLID